MSCFKKKSSHNMKSCNERIIHGEFHNIKHILSIFMISYILIVKRWILWY